MKSWRCKVGEVLDEAFRKGRRPVRRMIFHTDVTAGVQNILNFQYLGSEASINHKIANA